MKPVYGNISPKQGLYSAGICSITLFAKEWITSDIAPGHDNTITTPLASTNSITLNLVEDSMVFTEKQEESRHGSYFKASLAGETNDLSALDRSILETLRHHEFIVLLKDRNRNYRLAGNKDNGMRMSLLTTTTNAQGGLQEVKLSLDMLSETIAPYYIV